jgi:Cu/Ag efflux protein CusF
MKKILSVVLSLIFVFAVTSISFAAETKDAAAAPAVEQKEAAKPVQVTGEITAIDAAAKTFTVKGRKGEVAFSANDKTKVKAGKEAKTLADLKAGDKVTVKYTKADGKNMAKSVKIKTDSEKSDSKEKTDKPKE